MRYQISIVVLGCLVIALAFIYLPNFWNLVVHAVLGFLIILTGISIHQQRQQRIEQNEEMREAFSVLPDFDDDDD